MVVTLDLNNPFIAFFTMLLGSMGLIIFAIYYLKFINFLIDTLFKNCEDTQLIIKIFAFVAGALLFAMSFAYALCKAKTWM